MPPLLHCASFHRFIFHCRPTTNLGACLHFVLHGIHHRYPTDAYRLVFPPILGLPLAMASYLCARAALGVDAALCAVGGVSLGYLCYDLMHYLLHHYHPAAESSAWPLRAFLHYQALHKCHHMQHRHTFGVSPLGALWDAPFGTLASLAPKPSS